MALILQNCSTLQLEVAKNKKNASEMENESIPEIDNYKLTFEGTSFHVTVDTAVNALK